MKRLFFLVLLLFTQMPFLFAQFYSTGQDPASVRWKQIKTEHFQVLFNRDFQIEAQKIANILEYYYELAGQSLNHKPKKITVIVHNQTIFIEWIC
jgi:hypothetical protein